MPATPKVVYQENSFTILTISICLVIIGLSTLHLLNIQLIPSYTPQNLGVHYQWPNASARLIESEVTSKLEGVFNKAQGIESISSYTGKGHGHINIVFKKETNIDLARFEISNLVRQTYSRLPEQVSYPQLSLNVSGEQSRPILIYTLNAPANSFVIQEYAEKSIIPELSRVPGLHEVHASGGNPYEWEIKYNAHLLNQIDIPVSDLAQSIQSTFGILEIGKGIVVRKGEKNRLNVKLEYNTEDIASIGDIPVKAIKGRVIRVEDVASVTLKEKEKRQYFRINGLNTLNIITYPAKRANHVQLAENIKKRVANIKGTLPAGYAMTLSYDASEFINKELATILKRSLFSLGLLLLMAFLIYRQLKYLLLVFVSVLVNLIVAVILYNLFHLEIHLYSLAGITISFGIIIDTSIIMIDHLKIYKNKKALLGITGATLTTLGALIVVFFLEEEQRNDLVDFAMVIMINLTVSVLVAYFLIPAMMEKMKVNTRSGRVSYKRKRYVYYSTGLYKQYIGFSKKHRWKFFMIMILGFGLPFYWLPDNLEGDGWWTETYNHTLGAPWFKEDVRPVIEKATGGALRLFTEFVFENSYYSEPGRTMLTLRGTMPEGCTIHQLNEAFIPIENFLGQFSEIDNYRTNISSYRHGEVNITFEEPYEHSSFPHYLKSELESKAISLGGVDWAVYGVGRGFSNALYSGTGTYRIELEGYNYDQLYSYAEVLKGALLQNMRIKEVEITDLGAKPPPEELYLDLDMERMAEYRVRKSDVFDYFNTMVSKRNMPGLPDTTGRYYNSMVRSDQHQVFDVWNLDNNPIQIQDKIHKLRQFGSIQKRKSGNSIDKHNQQYKLLVVYDFIGPYLLASKVKDQEIRRINEKLPVGYKAVDMRWSGWDKENKQQYYLILLVILIVYIICAILFESFTQPLGIIGLIPVSFTGIFLTFYWFDINFDQGGYAAFIMVCGLVVNSGIYILNDHNNLGKANSSSPLISIYIKAVHHKIIPIMLTLVSTALGLVPFLWEGQNNAFWYSFAAGTIGGLVFSMIAVVIYLPLLVKLEVGPG